MNCHDGRVTYNLENVQFLTEFVAGIFLLVNCFDCIFLSLLLVKDWLLVKAYTHIVSAAVPNSPAECVEVPYALDYFGLICQDLVAIYYRFPYVSLAYIRLSLRRIRSSPERIRKVVHIWSIASRSQIVFTVMKVLS